MWEKQLQTDPIIIHKNDWSCDKYDAICMALGLEGTINSIVIREGHSIELDKEDKLLLCP